MRPVIVVSDESQESSPSSSPILSFTLPSSWQEATQRAGSQTATCQQNRTTATTTTSSRYSTPTTSRGESSANLSSATIARFRKESSSSDEDDFLPELRSTQFTQWRVYHGRNIYQPEQYSQVMFSDTDSN